MKLVFALLTLLLHLTMQAQQKIQHVSSLNNTTANHTFISAVGLDNNPNAIIIIEVDAANKSANPHSLGLWYTGGKWAIFNQDMAPMPVGITFQLTWKNADDKAFVFRSYKSNNQIDHPKLNNNPSALVQCSQLWNPGGLASGVYNNNEVSLNYNGATNKWQILNSSGKVLPSGSAFNIVIINEKQIGAINIQPTISTTVIQHLKKDSIRFRVTINGFTCNNATADHILEVDGKGDEVFAGGVTQYFNAATGERMGTAQRRWTYRYGDVNSEDARWGMRVRAGSKPNNMGGIQNGDQFPITEPWKRQAPIYKNTFPLLLTEGVLIKGENAAMVVPSIWEYDGTTEEEQQLNNFASTFGQVSIFFGTNIAGALLTGGLSIPFVTGANIGAIHQSRQRQESQPIDNIAMFAKFDYKLPEFNVIVSKTLFGDAKDRPIGMEDKDGYYDYTPLGLYLTYDNVIKASLSDYGFGRGILPLRFKDPKGMDGDYTIYIQVDKIDGKEKFTNPNEVVPYGENNNYNFYKISNVYSAGYLGANSTGAFASINENLSEWQFEKVDGALNSFYYYLKSIGGNYLGVPEANDAINSNGYTPIVTGKQAKSTHWWRIVSNSDGSYSILNVFSQKALIHDGPTKKVLLWENRANPEQRWKIISR
jgi:hypothetical protein